MSEKDGAEITPNDVDGITEYIASICAPTDGGATGDPQAMIDQEDPAFAVFGTISPVWRGGAGPGVQYNQFFPEMFIGGQWQGNVVSARVTACTACHGVGEDAGPSGGFLGRIDLVEAAVKLDIATMLTGTCPREWQLSLDAGRFIVPFGAFSSQVNPGVYRTVSKPLMFNMGQRVIEGDLGDPVLPMPFSDEGASLNGSFTLFSDGGMEPITLNYERLRREWFERWRWWHQFRHEPQYRDAEQQPVGGRPRVNRQSLGASWQLGDRRTLQR